MSVQVPLPPAFLNSSKFNDPTGKRETFTRNTHRKQEFVRMSRSSTTAAPPGGSTSCSLGYRQSPVSVRSSPLQHQTPQLQPKPYNEIADIGVLEDTERLDNRVLKEKSNLSKNASLAHRRKPSRATLRSSGVRFAEDTPQVDPFRSESDANNNNNDEKLRIPHKQSVLVLPKVPIGGVKLNSVKDRIAKQDEKLTSKNVTSEQPQPPKHHFFHNLDLKSVYSSEKTKTQLTSSRKPRQTDEVKHEEAATSSSKKLKPTKVSIANNPHVTPQSDSLTSDDLVVALLNARNSKLSSSNLTTTDTNPASCPNKMAATDGRWRSVTKLTKREENHVLLVEEEEEEEVFFRSSATTRQQPEVDELGQGQGPEPEAAGNVRVFHEQFMDDEELEGDFGNGLMSLGVSKDYSASLSSSQITVNGELCAQNSATADSTNLTSKLRSLLRDSGLDTTWEKNQTEFMDTVEMIDHEEQSSEVLSPKSDTTVIKDEQTSVKLLPEVTINGDHHNGLWFAEDKLKTRGNIDWDKLEKLHCSDEMADVDWLQKVRLRNVLEDPSCENRVSIPVSLSTPKQNGVDDDRKWMDPLLRLQQSGAVDWDSLDKKSLNTFGKVISNYSEDQTMTSPSPSSPLKVNLKHVRQIEVRRSENSAKVSEKSEEIPAVRVHLRHVETPTKAQQQAVGTETVLDKSRSESPDQVVLIKNTYNAQEWRQLEHEIETKRRPKVQTPSPDWVREAEEKRRSFHEWGSAFDSKQVRPCSDITDDGYKDNSQATNQWMSIQQLRSKKQEQQEDWQEAEVKNGHWQNDDGHSIRVHVPDVTSTDTVDVEEHTAKFDVEGYVKGLVRMRKSVPSKIRPQSSPDFAAHIATTPEWLPIAERKLRNSFDWDSLERNKKSPPSKPDVSRMDFEDEEGASESDSSAFSWYGGQKATKALDGSNRHEDPEWVQVSSKKKNIDWEQLEGRLAMTDDRETEAPWVSMVNLRSPPLTTAKDFADGFRLQDVDLRPVDVDVSIGSGVNSPCGPEWVEIAESKKRSDVDWQALDCDNLAPTSSEAFWTKAVSLRHVEDDEKVEDKVQWSKSDDSSSCSGGADGPVGSVPFKEGKVDRRISKFDPNAPQDIVRRKPNLEQRATNSSESLCEDKSPDWMKLVQYKQTVAVDWEQLENGLEKKVESPTLPEVVLRKVPVPPKPDDGSEIDCHVTWLEIADRKRKSGVDWDKLDADKPMTQSTEAVWVQGVNLKPATTKSAEVEDHDIPFESVNLRHIDPPEEDSTRDFSSGVLWEERPTTPNVDRWQARYKEMFIDLSGESSPPEEDGNRRGVHQIELSDHGELRHGVTWSRLLEDKEVEMEERVEEQPAPKESFLEYRVTRHVGIKPENAGFRPNPAPSWTENLKKPSPPTTLNIKQDNYKTEDQSWLSQTRLRSVSSKTSLNEEDASPTTPDWMSKVEKRRSTTIDWDTINSAHKEPESTKDGQWLKELSLREVKRNPLPEKFMRENKVSTEFKSLIKSPDIDARKILEDLPKRRRGTVRPKEPEVLTGREALMADIKGGKAKLRTTSTTSLDNDVSDVPYKKELSEVKMCTPTTAPLPPPPAPPVLPTSLSTSLSQKPQTFANVLDQIKNSGRDGLLASLRRAKTETKSKMDDGEKVVYVEPEQEQEQEEIAPEIVPKEPEENGSFQVTSDDGGNFSVVIDDKDDDADFLTKKPDVSAYTKSLSEKYFRKELESPRKVPKGDLKTGSSSPPRVLSTLSKSQSLKSQHTSDAHSSKSRFSSDPGDRKLIGKVSNARNGENLPAVQSRSSSRHVMASLASTSLSKTTAGSPKTTSGSLNSTSGSLNSTSGSLNSTSVSPESSFTSPKSTSFSPASTTTAGSPKTTSGSLNSTSGFLNSTSGPLNSTSGSLNSTAGPLNSTSISPNSTSSSLKSTLISPKSTSASPTSTSVSPTSASFKDLKDSLASVKLLQEMRTQNSSNPDLATLTTTRSSFTSFHKEPLLGIRTIRENNNRNTSDPNLATPTDTNNTTASLTSLHLLRNISESPARLSVSETDLVDSTADGVRKSSSRKVVTFDVEEPTATDDGCAMEDAEVAKITRRDVTDPKSWLSPTTSTSLKSRGVTGSSPDAKPVSSRVSLSSKAFASKTTKTAASTATARDKVSTVAKSRTERATSPKKEATRTSSPSPTKFGSMSTSTGSGTGSGTGRGAAGRNTRTERPSSPRKDSGRKKWEIPKPGSPVPVMCMAQETGSNSEASGSRRSSQFSQVIEEVAGPLMKTETMEVTSLPEATRSITTHTTSGSRYVTAKGKDEKNGKDTLIGARGDSTKTISQLETIRGPDEAVVATREVHGTSGQTVSFQRLNSGGQSVRKTTTTVTTVKTRRKLNP